MLQSRVMAESNHFELFGLSASFDLSVEDLESRYLAKARETHPDRFVNAEPKVRLAAVQSSMRLNDAYKTLKDPVARAEYLLAEHGVTIGANENLAGDFLIEVLELREELQE